MIRERSAGNQLARQALYQKPLAPGLPPALNSRSQIWAHRVIENQTILELPERWVDVRRPDNPAIHPLPSSAISLAAR